MHSAVTSPMNAALASRALGSAAYYVISPFLAIWLHSTLGVPVPLAATAVGVHLLSMRAGAVYMQFVVVRFRLRAVLVGGYLVAGAVMLVPVVLRLDDAASWLAVLAVNGTAVSCANVGTKALIANGCDEATRLAAFGRLNAAINGGAALGPVAGGWLMSATGRAFPLIPAAVFALAALLAARAPGDVTAAPPAKGAARFGLPSRQVLLWSCVTATLWLAYAQFANVLPVYMGTAVSTRVISMLFLVNAILIVLFQGVVARRMESLARRRGDRAVIALGMVLLAAGLVLFVPGRGPAWPVIFLGAAVFTFSELVWSPAADSIMARKAEGNSFAAFGFAGLVWGIAESAGGALGTAVAGGSTGDSWTGWSPFLVAAALSLLTALAVVLVPRRRAAPAPAPSPSPASPSLVKK
ncbi:MFS transporter [Streptomyces rectiverticillatus]|uniref:MFS transporter n=1 Tax=Streptomyces rectiverticillatus TaxID=173860 RepID=UPI0015C37E05|nr:MFS transporter [Streptomyces rectiverticillatus]